MAGILNDFFTNQLENLRCDRDTKAYIISVLKKFKNASEDCSKESITTLYAQAKYSQDFFTFQKVGDWLFLCSSMFPEHLNNASMDYYFSIGQSSYYYCYLILQRKWKLYEQMSDQLPELSVSTRKLINITHKY